MGIFCLNGEILGQNSGKKEAIFLGEAAFIRPLQSSKSYFGPDGAFLFSFIINLVEAFFALSFMVIRRNQFIL